VRETRAEGPTDGGDPVDESMVGLGMVLADLTRTLDRYMDRDFPHPRPPETHLAVLRLVRSQDGVTVRQVADALLMQSSNASTLVSSLCTAGLLRREQDHHDRRVVHLHLTPEARDRVNEADAQVGRFLTQALARLDPAQADAVTRAVPGLVALRRALS
jgi:DNA-binding MarR family transcriptional regulator